MEPVVPDALPQSPRVGLTEVLREWGRIGCLGFGGPPVHIAMLRDLCVDRKRWIDAETFEDAIAAYNLMPGPSSTQLAIFCAHRVGGTAATLVGGLAFVLPGLILILALAALFLGGPPAWIQGAGAGAGSAVAAVAVGAGLQLLPASYRRVHGAARVRWLLYVLAGGLAAAVVGPWLVLVLIACGAIEVAIRRPPSPRPSAALHAWPLGLPLLAATTTGGIGALCWTAAKVGALSYGGGFVIVPLMQSDAVDVHHWMTNAEFLNAVALGQVTPGPVVHTIAVVGYAAAGVGGGLLAAAVAFAPSFLIVLVGGERFERVRSNAFARGFLDGAGPAAIGAILGSAIPLALALAHVWQAGVLAVAAGALFIARRGVVTVLLGAGAIGAVAVTAGAPI